MSWAGMTGSHVAISDDWATPTIVSSNKTKRQVNPYSAVIVVGCGAGSLPIGSDIGAIPDNISDVYVDDYDIRYLHSIILRKLEEEKTKRIVELNAIVQAEHEKITKQLQTYVARTMSLSIIDSKQAEITEIMSGVRMSEYKAIATPLITEYDKLSTGPKHIIFGESSVVRRIDTPIDIRRHEIIGRFLSLALKYISHNITRKIKDGRICETCGMSLVEESVECCYTCGTRAVSFVSTNVDDDLKFSSKRVSKDYDNRDNMIKSMMHFQGRQVNKIPQSSINKIDEYFTSMKFPSMEEVKRFPLDEYGQRRGTGVQMLIKAFKACGLPDCYKNTMLIGHIIWDWVLPSISHLEEKIMDHYTKTQRVFLTIDGPRTSSISTQFRLFKHLEICNYPCRACDFKLPETPESITYHETTWKIMCDESGDPEIVYKETSW